MTSVIGVKALGGISEVTRLGGRGGLVRKCSRFVFSSEKTESVAGLVEIYIGLRNR